MAQTQTIEVTVKGMDCVECTQHVQHSLAHLPGVERVEVFLTAEKAVLRADPGQVTLPQIRKAVAEAGYSVPDQPEDGLVAPKNAIQNFTRPVLTLFGIVFGAVLFITVVGEWLGLFEKVTELVPWYVGLAIVLAGGYPVFRNVLRATFKKQVISHTLMTIGVLAALIVGQWATAAVIVFFMRVGDYAERFTTERARRAVKDLTAMAPQTARVEREGQETEIPVTQVQVGETIIVRPGETIPVDGEVLSGQATINQAAITGESMPVEAGPGSRVYAATIAQLGSLRVRTLAVGRDTTFGRVIQMVEEAEAAPRGCAARGRQILGLLPAGGRRHCRADLLAAPRSAGNRGSAGGSLFVFLCPGDPDCHAGFDWRGRQAGVDDQRGEVSRDSGAGGCAAGR